MGIFDSIFKGEYKNEKIYGNYALTKIQKPMTKEFAEKNYNTYTTQLEDCLRIINSTANPLTFFYRYDFAVKRCIDLVAMEKWEYWKHFSKQNVIPKKLKIQLIDEKQSNVKCLIMRMSEKTEEEIFQLQKKSSKENRIFKLENSLSHYQDEVSNENLSFLKSQAEELREKFIR